MLCIGHQFLIETQLLITLLYIEYFIKKKSVIINKLDKRKALNTSSIDALNPIATICVKLPLLVAERVLQLW